MKKEELDSQIRRHIQEGKKLYLVEGVFGDMENCSGYVKEGFVHPERGLVAEVFGCKFLYRGHTDQRLVDSVAATKRTLIASIRLVLKSPLIIPFLRIKHLIYWLAEIYEADLELKRLKDDEFCPSSREFIRVGVKFANEIEDKEYRERAIKVVYCIVMFLEDLAYGFRVQDVFEEMRKGVPVRKEIQRLLKVGFHRDHQIPQKWKMLSRLTILLWIPKFRRFAERFIDEINLENVKMSGSERYFTLNRAGYDFGGISYAIRKHRKDRIDEKLGNCMLDI